MTDITQLYPQHSVSWGDVLFHKALAPWGLKTHFVGTSLTCPAEFSMTCTKGILVDISAPCFEFLLVVETGDEPGGIF